MTVLGQSTAQYSSLQRIFHLVKLHSVLLQSCRIQTSSVYTVLLFSSRYQNSVDWFYKSPWIIQTLQFLFVRINCESFDSYFASEIEDIVGLTSLFLLHHYVHVQEMYRGIQNWSPGIFRFLTEKLEKLMPSSSPGILVTRCCTHLLLCPWSLLPS